MPTQLCASIISFSGSGHLDRKSTRLNSSHTVIYTLSLHDALPISCLGCKRSSLNPTFDSLVNAYSVMRIHYFFFGQRTFRSEEHTSELQSHSDLHSFPTRRSSDLMLGVQEV